MCYSLKKSDYSHSTAQKLSRLFPSKLHPIHHHFSFFFTCIFIVIRIEIQNQISIQNFNISKAKQKRKEEKNKEKNDTSQFIHLMFSSTVYFIDFSFSFVFSSLFSFTRSGVSFRFSFVGFVEFFLRSFCFCSLSKLQVPVF